MEDEKRDSRKTFKFNTLDFKKMIINDLNNSRSRNVIKKYTQSEVQDIIENYENPINQEKLIHITRMLWSFSQQYQRLTNYFAGMHMFPIVLKPSVFLNDKNKSKVMKQNVEIAELIEKMNIKHEMGKVLNVIFREDIFYGYILEDDSSFYIQHLDPFICRQSSIEDGVLNFSIDMQYLSKNKDILRQMPDEIIIKCEQWLLLKEKNPKINNFVELDPRNTICIKANETIREIFPPFAGAFDSIFDLKGFKELRKDKEELSNYMMITQRLPMRTDTENNNDFSIDEDTMVYFHNMIADNVPENVGVVTSPMDVKFVTFEKDRSEADSVAKAERDFWDATGTSKLLFNADKSTSQGLLMSIKSDEQIVFQIVKQIERWLNRHLKLRFKKDLMFNASILDVTIYNKVETFDMFLKAGQFGIPVKTSISAIAGLSPVEMLSMAYFENELLGLHEQFIPLMSSHVMGQMENGESGRPQKKASEITDEGARAKER